MANRDVLAIGTSAGGVEALRFLASKFPADLPAAVLVTIHVSSRHRSVLDEILSSAGPLRALFADDGMPLRKGQIYIAPSDRHLILEGDKMVLGSGPRENSAGPAVDPMLRSAAVCCGARAIGVVLTGTLWDGASGLWAVQQCGGLSVVQEPSDAAYPDMPRNALEQVKPDHIAPLRDMPQLLTSLVDAPMGKPRPAPEMIKLEVSIAKDGRSAMDELDKYGQRSRLTCPDCGGVMWEIEEGDLTRFRCHVGHTYAAEPMSNALDEGLRRALATALRALEERLILSRSLERQASERGHGLVARNWAEKVRECEREMEVIRGAVLRAG